MEKGIRAGTAAATARHCSDNMFEMVSHQQDANTCYISTYTILL